MEVKKYKNLKAAIERNTKESMDYVFVRHTLTPREKIKLHYHNKANEFIIIDNGKFKVRIGNKEKKFNLKYRAIKIYFPKKQKHSLLPLTKISYFVFRDARDNTIYC